MRNLVVLALFVVAACGDGGGNGDGDLAEGLLGFHYGLSSGFGFCAEPGMLYRVDLATDDRGELMLSGSRLDSGNRGQSSCLPNVSSGACLIEQSLTPRTLTDAETRTILATFDGVRVETESPPECGAEDPCLIQGFAWINRRNQREVATNAFGDPCGPRLAEKDAQAITSALDALFAAPTGGNDRQGS
jgi:hypothetical protein